MRWVWVPLVLAALLAGCVRKSRSQEAASANGALQAAYAPRESCAACHSEIAESYQHVAMARSVFRPGAPSGPANMVEDFRRNNHFFHAASNRHYRMIERQGRYYQQRYQLDTRRREINLLEQEITYVIGSGIRARSYVHLSPAGELTEMPVTWYTEERRWGMSPGYDRPRHPDFSRPIDNACMFCHDAYPELPGGADRYGMAPRFSRPLPEGVDCQRCHGPGARHVELASSGKTRSEQIRAAIVNPARLTAGPQLDICQQCHLEATSGRLPQAVARFNRPAYSFRPGEHLADFLVHFDHPAGSGHDDKFEIVSAAYRLRKSACFQKSGGRLTCTTCHNPHRAPEGDEATAKYRTACRGCHNQVAAPHPDLASSNCVTCHMPKRRTEDVVHATMIDHLIQRKPRENLLAPLQETDPEYHGGVALYEPTELPQPVRDLYMGIALAKDGADRPTGIATLEKGIAAAAKSVPIEAYIELAVAYDASRNPRAAVENYRKALALDPHLAPVRYDLGRALLESGDPRGARAEFDQALRDDPNLPEAHNNLGTLLAQAGETARAIQEYQTAIGLRPDYAEAQNNLSKLYTQQGQTAEARIAAEEALRSNPDFGPAYTSVGILLAQEGRMDAAASAFERAVGLEPGSAEAHYNFGRALEERGKRAAAVAEYRRTIELDGGFAPAHLSLGVALGESGQLDAAANEFREALRLRPGYPDAQRNLQLLQEMKSGR
jgi:predicted CXXCH cytochrome family protein